MNYLSIDNPRLAYWKQLLSNNYSNLAMWGRWQTKVESNISQFAGEAYYLTQGQSEKQYNDKIKLFDRGINIDPFIKLFDFDKQWGARVVGGFTRASLEALQECLFLKTYLPILPKSILDIGCGYGRLLPFLKLTFPESFFIVGTDCVPVSLFLTEYYIQQLKKNGILSDIGGLFINEPKNVTKFDLEYDLAINIHSWNECSYDEVKRWLDVIKCKYLFTVSHDDRWYTWGDGREYKSLLKSRFDVVQEGRTGLEDTPTVLWRKK